MGLESANRWSSILTRAEENKQFPLAGVGGMSLPVCGQQTSSGEVTEQFATQRAVAGSQATSSRKAAMRIKTVTGATLMSENFSATLFMVQPRSEGGLGIAKNGQEIGGGKCSLTARAGSAMSVQPAYHL